MRINYSLEEEDKYMNGRYTNWKTVRKNNEIVKEKNEIFWWVMRRINL